jgi:hypothetical protein
MEVPAQSFTNTINSLIKARKDLPKSVIQENPEIRTKGKNDILAGSNDSFKILYQETDGTERTYLFALLPAVDSGGGTGISGRTMVPEVKPGIAIISSMKQKNIIVPGGAPVAQTIGIESTLLQCVGAFIGSELANAGSRKVGDLSPIYYGYNGVQRGNSEAKAKEFMQKVVQSGRPVTFQLETSYKTKVTGPEGKLEAQNAVMKYRGLVVGFKYFAQRSNRTYYSLNLLITDYNR